jgi:hypothetical protein
MLITDQKMEQNSNQTESNTQQNPEQVPINLTFTIEGIFTYSVLFFNTVCKFFKANYFFKF